MVKLLLDHKASSAVRSTEDETALDLALRGGHEALAELLGASQDTIEAHKQQAAAAGAPSNTGIIGASATAKSTGNGSREGVGSGKRGAADR